MEEGVLDQYEVETAINRRFGRLRGCYRRAGRAVHYVEGQVLMRLTVAPQGDVSDVAIAENTLGNYAVERCLIEEMSRIRFRPPGGRKGATFEYPVQFRSTGEVAVSDLDGGYSWQILRPLMAEPSACPRVGPGPVFAVAYVEPDGQVGSVGFEAEQALDLEAAACVHEQIRRWRLPSERSHVMRTRFRLSLASVP